MPTKKPAKKASAKPAAKVTAKLAAKKSAGKPAPKASAKKDDKKKTVKIVAQKALPLKGGAGKKPDLKLVPKAPLAKGKEGTRIKF